MKKNLVEEKDLKTWALNSSEPMTRSCIDSIYDTLVNIFTF